MMSFTMAWRNVWRNRRRSAAAVAATSLGLLMMVLYSGLVTGYIAGMERRLLDVEMGDAQIFHPQYQETHSIHDRIENPDRVLSQLDEAGLPAAPRLLGSGLAAAGTSSAGVSLRGVDVERDATVSEVSEQVAEGHWLDAEQPNQVVIGKRLAQMLGVDLGDELVVLSQGADGSTANDLYYVRGVLKSVSDGVDRGGIFMLESAFRELMYVPDGAHQIIVRRGSSTIEQADAKLDEVAPELDAQTWRELNPTLASMFDSAKSAMVIMFMIIYIAIGIVILNAMLMTVFERIREFGVLKAIGVGPFGVLKLIMLETMIQVGVAIVIGVTLSLPLNWYLVTHGLDLSGLGEMSVMGVAADMVWRSEVTAATYVQPIFTLVFIVGLAVTYPALKAAFIKPIEAMQSQ